MLETSKKKKKKKYIEINLKKKKINKEKNGKLPPPSGTPVWEDPEKVDRKIEEFVIDPTRLDSTRLPCNFETKKNLNGDV